MISVMVLACTSTLLTVGLIALLVVQVSPAAVHSLHWNSSNPIFRIDNTDHIVDVNSGNLPFEYDQLNIICPVAGQGRGTRGREEGESVSVQLSVARVDDSPLVEHTTLTQKIKQKSRKIVMDAEQGEARTAIEKCKNFLSSVQSSNFACKIFINSWEVSSVSTQPVRSMFVSISGHRGD